MEWVSEWNTGEKLEILDPEAHLWAGEKPDVRRAWPALRTPPHPWAREGGSVTRHWVGGVLGVEGRGDRKSEC